MEIASLHSQNPNHLEVTVTGRIDSATASDFQDAVDKDQKDNVTDVIVDLSNVNYISAAGLRALIAIKKRCANNGLKMELVGCQDRVADTLHLTGFSNFFPRFPDIYEARQALTNRN